MRQIKMILLVLSSLIMSNFSVKSHEKEDVLFCYGKLKAQSIVGYKYVVLEAKHYTKSEIATIKKNNVHVLAYISLGEINAHSEHYKMLKDNTLGKNENWNSHYLDLSSNKTVVALMLIIKDLMNDGYDGLFLDNIDNFSTFGKQKEHKEYLIKFLSKLRKEYPKLFFLQNAGLDIVDDTNKFVDAVAIESVATNYTFNDKKYKLRDEEDYKKYITKLKNINNKYSLPIILIEYADTKKLHDAIVKRISSTGFSFFIGKIDLQTLPKYTK